MVALNPRMVIPGHGTPFTEVGAALEHCFNRVRTSRGNPERMTRHAFKAMLAFILLDKGGMPLADLPDYLAGIPFYREFNDRYLKQAPLVLAQLLVTELEKSGAVSRRDDVLPTG